MTLKVTEAASEQPKEKIYKLSELKPRDVFRFAEHGFHQAKDGEGASIYIVVEEMRDANVMVFAMTGQAGPPIKKNGDRPVIMHGAELALSPPETV